MSSKLWQSSVGVFYETMYKEDTFHNIHKMIYVSTVLLFYAKTTILITFTLDFK